jgi:HPt (histidine-containing phosphotransfer) domain-containing protein
MASLIHQLKGPSGNIEYSALAQVLKNGSSAPICLNLQIDPELQS